MGCGVSSRHGEGDEDDGNGLMLTVTYNRSAFPLVTSAMKKPGAEPRTPRSVHWNDERLAEPLCPTPNAQTPSQGEIEMPADAGGAETLWLDGSPNGEDAGQRQSLSSDDARAALSSGWNEAEISPNGEEVDLQRRSVSLNLNEYDPTDKQLLDKLQVSMLNPTHPENITDQTSRVDENAAIAHWVAHTAVVSLLSALKLTRSFRPLRPVGPIGALLSSWSALPFFADPALDPFGKPLEDAPPSPVHSEPLDPTCGGHIENTEDGEEEVSSASGSFRCLPRAESFREEQLLQGKDRSLELTLFAKGLADAVLAARACAERERETGIECFPMRSRRSQISGHSRAVSPQPTGATSAPAGAAAGRGKSLVKSMFPTTSLSPVVLAAWDAVEKGAVVEDHEVGCAVLCAFPLSVALQSFGARCDSPPKFAEYFWRLLEADPTDTSAEGRTGEEKEGKGITM